VHRTTAWPIAATGVRADRLDAPGAAGLFRLTVADSGRLTALVHGNGLDTRLSLLGPDGRLLVQSDGQSAADRDDLIAQHLLAGTYFLRVEGLGGGAGGYTLTTEFLPASPPGQPIPVASQSNTGMVTGDSNGDGIPDLLSVSYDTPSLVVLLGLGDGTFQKDRPVDVGFGYQTLAQGDFNADGRLDIVLVDPFRNQVVVLLGRGDGTFGDRQVDAVVAN